MTQCAKALRDVLPVLASMSLFAAGCQFRVNPDFVTQSADLAPTDDLASVYDLSTATDLGTSGPPPSADLSSPCTRVIESFAADASTRWTVMGDATLDPSHGAVQLTSLGFNVAGSAFYDRALPGGSFDATFTFRIADGAGADGLAFVFANAASAGALTPFGNGALNAGYGVGYLGMDGFAVELDTFMNLGNGDPNGNHVSLVRTSDGTHLLSSGTMNQSLRATASRVAHIRFNGVHLLVEIDGGKTIDADLPSGLKLPAGSLFFGFTAASSAVNDHHAVSDLTLILGPAATCF
ncbi:MAG: hypothetical protein JWN44_4735 [Myxococcales bacterium]|nr:hypothetical protein [Myxococcales bacterium]